MTVVGVVQARLKSSRLPRKVLLPFGGATIIDAVIVRASRASSIDQIVVAIPEDSGEDELDDYLAQRGHRVFRGPESDLTSRIFGAAKKLGADHAVRITADCPLVDAAVIDSLVDKHLTEQAEITLNYLPPTFPDGLDVSCIDLRLLEKLAGSQDNAHDREHVTTGVEANPESYRVRNLQSGLDLSGHRWTIDNIEDYFFLTRVADVLGDRLYEAGYQEILGIVHSSGLRDASWLHGRNDGHKI